MSISNYTHVFYCNTTCAVLYLFTRKFPESLQVKNLGIMFVIEFNILENTL